MYEYIYFKEYLNSLQKIYSNHFELLFQKDVVLCPIGIKTYPAAFHLTEAASELIILASSNLI